MGKNPTDSAALPSHLRLPLRFVAARLEAELARIAPGEWTPHFNSDEHVGDWSGVALRAPAGDPGRLDPGPDTADGYRDTPVLARTPYLREVLQAFGCRLLSARLLRLGPGARIHEHRDYGIGPDCGRVRLHVPICTGEGVRFVVAGRRVDMSPGEVWYADFGLPHGVENGGATDRVHLVLDCVYDAWLSAVMAQALAASPGSGPEAAAESPLDAFRRRLLTDATLAGPLQGCPDPTQLARQASALASRDGAPVSPEEVLACLRAGRRGGARLHVAEPPALPGWLPSTVDWGGGAPLVEWCWLGERPLADAFYSDTLRRARREPFNQFVRPTSPLESLAPPNKALRVAGFIAHVSRCGSTLVARMLAELPGVVVVSEAPVLDSVLCGGPDVAQDARLPWIRAMVGALARPRRGGETSLVVKLDSWHVPYLPLLSRAFPEVPRVLVYRDPLEVLASQLREPGGQMVPGALPGPFRAIPADVVAPLPLRSRVLGTIFDAAAAEREWAALVGYPDLPEAVWSAVAPAFGLTADGPARQRGREICRRHAKDPQRDFVPDTQAKRDGATPEQRSSAERWAGPAFRELERRRAG